MFCPESNVPEFIVERTGMIENNYQNDRFYRLHILPSGSYHVPTIKKEYKNDTSN